MIKGLRLGAPGDSWKVHGWAGMEAPSPEPTVGTRTPRTPQFLRPISVATARVFRLFGSCNGHFLIAGTKYPTPTVLEGEVCYGSHLGHSPLAPGRTAWHSAWGGKLLTSCSGSREGGKEPRGRDTLQVTPAGRPLPPGSAS